MEGIPDVRWPALLLYSFCFHRSVFPPTHSSGPLITPHFTLLIHILIHPLFSPILLAFPVDT